MAKAESPPTAAASLPLPKIEMPAGMTNLAMKYPVYDGGDARVLKKGTKTAPIHGLLLGIIELPSVQVKEDGTPNKWTGAVIELLQPCPATTAGEEEPTVRPAGERIILTVSAALERFESVARDPKFVYEVFIEPEVSTNRAGAR